MASIVIIVKMPMSHPASLMAQGIESNDDPIIVLNIEKLEVLARIGA